MKKLLILTAILLTACSTEKQGCSCTAKYSLGNGDTYLVPNNPIDCDTKQPTKVAQSGYFVGCVD